MSTNGTAPNKVRSSLDREMDIDGNVGGGVGIAVRNGPVEEQDLEVNGRSKRKAQASTYKEQSSSEEDGLPLYKRRRTKAVESSDDDKALTNQTRMSRKSSSPMVVKKLPKKLDESLAQALGEDSDDDVPLATKLATEKKKIQKKAEKTTKVIAKKAPANRKPKKQAPDSDSDKPIKPKKKHVPAPKTKMKAAKREETSDDDVPLSKKPATKRKGVKEEVSTPIKNRKAALKKEETPATPNGVEDDEEDEYKWWENSADNDGTIKWNTLEHNGVIFPPPYEPLPKHVKMKYNGVPINLSPEAEEVAGFYGAMLNSEVNVTNRKFNLNFFADFQKFIKDSGGAKGPDGKVVNVKSFDECDFKPIFEYYETKREEKKAMPVAEKKLLKAEKDKAEEDYLYCLLNGRKEKVGNFRVEPPGLFRGRGDHPKTGKVKLRVKPEQIIINIGTEAPIPAAPAGHKWKEVRHDNTVTWLATWTENINNNIKYVMLAATSSLKGMSDFKKFEKARELKTHIAKIRKDYTKDLKVDLMADRQRATAMYLIDQFALRAGNEKGEDEADTVGCCSLRLEHITLREGNVVRLDFLGKDSIRFCQDLTVDAQVFKNLRIFKKAPKGPTDLLFDRLNTTMLNKHLQSYMPGLSAKVFRTYNASWTMQQEMNKIANEGNVADKVLAYNRANRRVAVLCNHQRTISNAHGQQMAKIEDKIKGMKYQQQRLKKMMLSLEPKLQKKERDYFEEDPALDQDWIVEHQQELVETERAKITKKFIKENEKLAEEGQSPMKDKELQSRLAAANEMEEMYRKENKTGKVEPTGKTPSVEKYKEAVEKLDARIKATETQQTDKEENKSIALGTSKINYIDPRLTVMFCKKYDVPLEKLFAKTLREKFKWAIESADEFWEF